MSHSSNASPLALLMEPGSRPLFAARALLEAVARAEAQGEPWSAMSHAHAIGIAAALRVFSELAQRARSQRAQMGHDAFNALRALPVIFPPELARSWEVDRPWAAAEFGANPNASAAYARLLDEGRPSDAYQADGESWSDPSLQIWRLWFESVSASELAFALESSADAIERWSAQRPTEQRRLPTTHNIELLCDRLGLSADTAAAWSVFECLGGICSRETGVIWKWASSTARDGDDFFGLWERAMGLSSGSIGSLLTPGGALVKLGLCQSLDLSSSSFIERARSNSWEGVWSHLTLGQRLRRELRSPNSNAEGVLGAFMNRSKEPAFDLSAWSHLGSAPERLKNALQSPSGARVLIWGPPGAGKTELALALAKAAGAQAWEPQWPPADAERAAEAGVAAVAQTQVFAAALGQSVALVDECERVWSVHGSKARVIDILEASGASQIWIANGLEACPEAALRRFDAIVELKEMPASARQALAESLFSDPDLAFRVAQAIKTPAGISAAARWCALSGDFSWSSARDYMSGQARAVQAALDPQNTMSFPAWEDSGEPLPELSGNASLVELQERLADALAHPQRYKALGAALPKGALLMGPPGTGKTLFARQLARSLRIPVIAPDTAALAAHPARIRALFQEARKLAPCLIFLDEADAILGSPMEPGGVNATKQQIVNTFLTELDGSQPSEGVMVIAATHRPQDMLEPAALRSGRLSEIISLRMPAEADRDSIWQAHMKLKPLDLAIKSSELAAASCGFSGAEIAEALNLAAASCARAGKARVEAAELLAACDNVFWGAPDSSLPVNEAEKWLTAVHEAGHAMIAWKSGLRVPRVTARPRALFMGATHWTPEEGSRSMNRETLLARVQMTLGGLAAEQTLIGSFSNGGSQDLESARSLMSHAMTQTGLGQTLGVMAGGSPNHWSEARRQKMESEEKDTMDTLFEEALSWLSERSELLRGFATDLMVSKELSGAALELWGQKVRDSALSSPHPAALARSKASGVKRSESTLHSAAGDSSAFSFKEND